jgi:hypothetical protein
VRLENISGLAAVAAAQSGGFLLRFIARIVRPQGLGVGNGGPKAAGPGAGGARCG